MKSANRNQLVALLASATLFSGSAWSWSPSGETIVTRTETVKYDPARAATHEGAAELYLKLRQAAVRVCSDPTSSPGRLAGRTGLAACISDALANAVQDLGIPMVSVLHMSGAQPGTTVAKR